MQPPGLGDVLVARMPDPLGRACQFPRVGQPAVAAVDVCVIRPGSAGCESRWLMWAINSPRSRRGDPRLAGGGLEDIDDLPPPALIAQEIVEDVEAALAEFAAIARSLEVGRRRERYQTLPATSEWERPAII